MAKYNVTYSCGHAGEVQLYGPGKERERKLEWMRSAGLCPDCYKARKQAERAAAEAAATTTAAEAVGELPAFTAGSERQIEWATRIRAEKLAAIEQIARTNRLRAIHGTTLPESQLEATEADRNRRIAAGAPHVPVADPERLARIEAAAPQRRALLKAMVDAHTDAAWWIDRRDLTAHDFAALAAHEGGVK